jgi:hypothetical protein
MFNKVVLLKIEFKSEEFLNKFIEYAPLLKGYFKMFGIISIGLSVQERSAHTVDYIIYDDPVVKNE